MNEAKLKAQSEWVKNKQAISSDWLCGRCRKYNSAQAPTCGLCGCAPTVPTVQVGLKAESLPVIQASAKLSTDPSTLCLRNGTSHTLWFYTERTAPIDWVHLRPGEACDLPSQRYSIFTLGASMDEPDRIARIGLQFAFAFGVIAFPLLLVLPEPTSKAIGLYLIGTLAGVGGMAGGSIVMGVSNSSNLKQVGVETRDGTVWELSEDLERYSSLANGTKVGEYSYHWTDVTNLGSGYDGRFYGWEKVEHGVDRGDLEKLPPLGVEALQYIKHHADIGEIYMDSIDYWNTKGELQQHEFSYGGSGGSESSTIIGATGTEGSLNAFGYIAEVRLWACKFIDAIQVKYNHEPNWEAVSGAGNVRTAGIFSDSNSTDHGGYGGYFKCEDGDYISNIELKYDKYIVTLQFFTHHGKKSKVFGGRDGDGENFARVENEQGDGWIGYRCSYNKWMDAMTFLMASAKKPS